MTLTKKYAVGYESVDRNIPVLLWNFVERHPGHSKCIMDLIGEWVEHNTFAECCYVDCQEENISPPGIYICER